jgi:hypothetical protein
VLWLFFAVFIVGYFSKFYAISLGIQGLTIDRWGPENPETNQLFAAFQTCVLGFCSFIGTACYLASDPRKVRFFRLNHRHWPNAQKQALLLCLASLVLMTVTFSLALQYGIGVMGADSVKLPFKLSGAIFYCRFLIIPALLMTSYYFGRLARNRFASYFPVCLLVVHGIADALLRSSRGQIAITVVGLMIMILIIDSKFSKSLWAWGLIAICVTVITAPIITAYRTERSADKYSIVRPLEKAFFENHKIISSATGGSLDGFHFIVKRITGVEMLLVYVDRNGLPLGLDALSVWKNGGMAGYVTRDVLMFPEGAHHSAAVSSVGWFYLVWGNLAVALGICLLTLAIWYGWRALCRSNLLVAPAAMASYFTLSYSIMAEGLLDQIGSRVVILVVTYIVLEIASRQLWIKDRRLVRIG